MNRWFGDDERAIATALMTLSLPFGEAITMAFTGLWFHKVEDEDFKESFKNLMMLQAVLTIALWCIFNLVMKERPDTLPSSVAEVPYEYLDFLSSLTNVGQNTNFVLLIIAFGLVYGTIITCGSLISNLLDPFGFTGSEAAFLRLPLLFTGLIGAVSMGFFLDKTNRYRCALPSVTALIALFMSMALFTLTKHQDNHMMLITSVMSIGVVYGGFLPLCFSYGGEITFPL